MKALIEAAGGERGTLRVGLHSFVMIRCLGKGSSGTAELVRRKADGVLLVLKVIEVIPPSAAALPPRHRRTHRSDRTAPTSFWPTITQYTDRRRYRRRCPRRCHRLSVAAQCCCSRVVLTFLSSV